MNNDLSVVENEVGVDLGVLFVRIDNVPHEFIAGVIHFPDHKFYRYVKPMFAHLEPLSDGRDGRFKVHWIAVIGPLAKKTVDHIDIVESKATYFYPPGEDVERDYKSHTGSIVIPSLTVRHGV